MRLYTSEKEARTLQLALATLIAKGSKKEREDAQALLQRIATCLALQVSQHNHGDKSSR